LLLRKTFRKTERSVLNFKRLFYGRRDVFGLDVGSSYVKAVQLRQDEEGYSLITAGCTEITRYGGDDRAKISNTISAIRQCIKSAQIKTKYAVCGIRGPNVALRRFRFPAMEAEEIDEAVLSEAEQACPFDYQLFNNSSGSMSGSGNPQDSEIRGMLAAATMDFVGHKSQLVKAASLNCVLMDVDGLALLNCFSECERPEGTDATAVICVGSKFTNFAILSGDGIPFVRDISHAADEIINTIANKHNVSSQVVRDILNGSSDKKITEFKGSMESACERLTGDIAQTLRYYIAQEGQGVGRIFVCGGFARAKGFIELLNRQLPTEAVLWNPLEKMRFDSAAHGIEIVKEHGCGLALAAGLAMRTI
jgi:type IV pilus assembly protein PilM